MTNTPISINPEFRINLDPLEVLSMLLDALGTSKKMAKEVNEATNFNRSALFASNVCIGLDGLVRQAWSREPPLKKTPHSSGN